MENSQYRMPDKMANNHRLVFNKVKQKSQDTYQCVADNGVDTKRLLFYLKVKNKKRDGVPTFGKQRSKLDTATHEPGFKKDSRTSFERSRTAIITKTLDPGGIRSAPKTSVDKGVISSSIGNTLGTSYDPGDSGSVHGSPTGIGHLGSILQRSLSGKGSSGLQKASSGNGKRGSTPKTTRGALDDSTISPVTKDMSTSSSTDTIGTSPTTATDKGSNPSSPGILTDPGDAGTTSVLSTDKGDIDTTTNTWTTGGDHVSTSTDKGDIATTPGIRTDKGYLATSPGVSIGTTDIATTMKISTDTGDITTNPVAPTDAGGIIDSTRASTQTVDVVTKPQLPTSKQKRKSTAKPVLPTTIPVFPVRTDRKKGKPVATSRKFAQHTDLQTKRFSTKKHVKTTPLILKTEKRTHMTQAVKVKPGVVKTNMLHTETTAVIPDKSTKATFHGWPHGMIMFKEPKLDHRARSARIRVLCLLLALVCTMLVILILAAVLWYRKVRTELIFDDEALHRVSRKAIRGKIEQKRKRRRIIKFRRKKPRDKKKTDEEIKEIDRKGRENRKVIGKHASENRRSSLADEIAYAKSVILKSKDEKEKDYVNSVTRKIIKDSSKDRRQSFEKDLLFAKNVIVA